MDFQTCMRSAGLGLIVLSATTGRAQAPGVPIFETSQFGRESGEDRRVRESVEALRKAGKLLDFTTAKAQLDRTTPHPIELPAPKTKPVKGGEIWEKARASYLRIGYYYLCHNCSNWHMSLAGGYVIAKEGIAVTCHHVIAMDPNMREGYLFAADDQGVAHPVHEVLVSSQHLDIAILRTGATNLPALPLNTQVRPGDAAYLFSDPQGYRGYFSEGMVNRFVKLREDGAEVVRMNVSTDWTPGSSGAGVIDQCGNAIGHVAMLYTVGNPPMPSAPEGKKQRDETIMVIHSAARAADVLSLIKTAPRAK